MCASRRLGLPRKETSVPTHILPGCPPAPRRSHQCPRECGCCSFPLFPLLVGFVGGMVRGASSLKEQTQAKANTHLFSTPLGRGIRVVCVKSCALQIPAHARNGLRVSRVPQKEMHIPVLVKSFTASVQRAELLAPKRQRLKSTRAAVVFAF